MTRSILTITATGIRHPEEETLRKLEAANEYPRVTLYQEALNSDMLDEHYLAKVPFVRRVLYALLPTFLAQVLEAWSVLKRYDAVVSWGERYGLPLAVIMKLTGRTVPHVGIFGWPAKGLKALMLKFAQSHCHRLIMWSTVQKKKVIEELHVPPDRIDFIKWPVDEKFFRPIEQETDMICAVGSEMRDYPTLLAALKGLSIPCHIAAGTLVEKNSKWVQAAERHNDTPPHVTIGKKSLVELRELYARSRFVVIPLHETETDNGVTCILEAFAMGRPVICSRTIGQVDVIEEGVTGLFVPVGDADALRSAIVFLWNNPERAAEMGRAARAYIERFATLEQFVTNVRASITKAMNDVGCAGHSLSIVDSSLSE